MTCISSAQRITSMVMLLFAFVTVKSYSFDCEGNGTCLINLNGTAITCFPDLGLDWTELCRNSRVLVCRIDYKELHAAGCFDMFLETGRDSKITLCADQPLIDLFPADVTVEVYGTLLAGNLTFLSQEPLLLRATELVDTWPPQTVLTYNVMVDVVYNSTSTSDVLTIKAGSQVQMQ